MSHFGIKISSSRSISSSFSFPLFKKFVLGWGLVSNILALIICMLGMEIILEIVGIDERIDTVHVAGGAKIDADSSVDEVLVTFVNEVLN